MASSETLADECMADASLADVCICMCPAWPRSLSGLKTSTPGEGAGLHAFPVFPASMQKLVALCGMILKADLLSSKLLRVTPAPEVAACCETCRRWAWSSDGLPEAVLASAAGLA